MTSHGETFRSIVVPTDFSTGARRAAGRATLLGLQRRASIHLVHVLPRGTGGAHDRDSRQRLDGLARYMRLLCVSRDVKSEPKITAQIVRGESHVEIVRYARTVDADLIVIGRKGSGPRLRQVLGRTAERVLRMSELPVLVVGRPAREAYRRPMLALVLDESSRRLVRLARAASASDLSAMRVVHAYHVPYQGLIYAGTDAAPSTHRKYYREKANAGLARLMKVLPTGNLSVRTALREGDPRQVIMAEAADMQADLIVMGTHGRSGIAHVLLGSVAEWVIAATSLDVLVARPTRFTFELP